MFSSGYLIRPCEGGGCIIHVVDHYDNEVGQSSNLLILICNFSIIKLRKSHSLIRTVWDLLQPWSVPEVLRPLYESPAVLAQKSTIAVCIATRSHPVYVAYQRVYFILVISWA